jgi:gluconokinase
MILILMGVSGAGKTTIGELLARDLGWPFHDGDDFHPQMNIDKMRRGVPLTDDDRAAWLAALRQLIDRLLQERQSAIIACSALRQTYRKRLQGDDRDIQFVYLKGDPALIRRRLQERQGHFMKAGLLANQFETLEEPHEVITVDVSRAPQAIVKCIKKKFGFSCQGNPR